MYKKSHTFASPLPTHNTCSGDTIKVGFFYLQFFTPYKLHLVNTAPLSDIKNSPFFWFFVVKVISLVVFYGSN
jgi:hypothetical protein